ncbi:MAG: glycosyltransferase family 4 protein [Caldilineaceae bacterium]|nr:glycosyltransferase family 4 protein [Caldilineaceae bacterium]
MNILHINNADVVGGASRAAYRLHLGLNNAGISSEMLVFQKQTHDPRVHTVPSRVARVFPRVLSYLDVLPTRLYRNRQQRPGWAPPWGTGWLTHGDTDAAHHRSDIAHIHWVGSEFFSVSGIERLRRPIVWTLHDMWPFTGGCHYAQGCTRYQVKCGRCPLLGSNSERDLSRWVWGRKKTHWQEANITIVAPSRWIGDHARRSSLFGHRRVEVIPYGLDLTVYRPIDKALARSLLGLPQGQRLVLFGTGTDATDPRKGFVHLQAAMESLLGTEAENSTALVIIGPATSNLAFSNWRTHYLGHLHDDLTLVLVYSAVDVLVAPYVEDNLPNMILESLACSTPCVAFDIGGMPDMIEHMVNGYLAQPFQPDDLANGLHWVLEDDLRRANLGDNARRQVESQFALVDIVYKHQKLYESLIMAYT